jgi:hypothetical protein
MEDDNPAFVALVDGLQRGLDAYLAQKASPAGSSSRRLKGLPSIPETELDVVMRERFPDWLDVAADLAVANGRDERWLSRRHFGTARVLAQQLLELLKLAGPLPDTAAVARRAAGYLAGRPLPLWEYVTVDIAVPVTGVRLFNGWELCGVDRANDPTLPVEYPEGFEDLWSPGVLHAARFGTLRRPADARTLQDTSTDESDLLWPLIALSLLGATPVRAFIAYLVEPGRRVIRRTASTSYLPAEVTAWHANPLSLLPYQPQVLDATVTADLGQYAAEIGARIDALAPADRRQFACAAGHHLYLGYQQAGREDELDASYIAFRRTVAVETLLRGADSDHESIGRKVVQRAAVLIGADDEDRLAVQGLIRRAYGARSTFVHGGTKTKQVDQPALARACRVIMRRWLALAAEQGGKRLVTLLDDALLSVSVRDGLLRTLADHERRTGSI